MLARVLYLPCELPIVYYVLAVVYPVRTQLPLLLFFEEKKQYYLVLCVA